MSEWISVKDRLPLVGQLVLIFLHDRPCFKNKMLTLDGFLIWSQRVALYDRLNDKMPLMFLDESRRSFEITYWMPLPEPPEQNGLG